MVRDIDEDDGIEEAISMLMKREREAWLSGDTKLSSFLSTVLDVLPDEAYVDVAEQLRKTEEELETAKYEISDLEHDARKNEEIIAKQNDEIDQLNAEIKTMKLLQGEDPHE